LRGIIIFLKPIPKDETENTFLTVNCIISFSKTYENKAPITYLSDKTERFSWLGVGTWGIYATSPSTYCVLPGSGRCKFGASHKSHCLQRYLIS